MSKRSHFYPRSPCGERLGPLIFNVQPRNFYPRSPCGERPQNFCVRVIELIHFYPRSPCGERLRGWTLNINGPMNFYPRSPCGERQQVKSLKIPPLCISIHALLAESDPAERHANSQQEKFLSTLSLRRATGRR